MTLLDWVVAVWAVGAAVTAAVVVIAAMGGPSRGPGRDATIAQVLVFALMVGISWPVLVLLVASEELGLS